MFTQLKSKKFFNPTRFKSNSMHSHGFDLMKWSKRLLVFGSLGIISFYSFTLVYTKPIDFPGLTRTQYLPEPLRDIFMRLRAAPQEHNQIQTYIQNNMILSEKSQESKLVVSIASRLLNSSNIPKLKEIELNVIVIDQPNQVSAFCNASGTIFITSGTIRNCKNVDEIAFVLAHEIAHIAFSHTFERHFNRSLELARIQEDEADYIGLILCSRASYNPEKAIRFFETLSSSTGIQKLYVQRPHCVFQHNHPDIRAESLKRLLPLAH